MSPFASITSWIRRHPIVSVASAAAGVGLAAWLFFGVFAFHLVFVDETVSEAEPFAARPETPEDVGEASAAGRASATEAASASDEASTEDEDVEEVEDVEDVEEVEDATPEASEEDVPAPEDSPTSPSLVAAGNFVDRSHPTTGRAEVVTDGSQRVLRLEDLMTDNGPDLNVYLVAAEPDAPVSELAADVVDLGDLKGNIGDQNYVVPDHVDLDRYTTVVIWCVRFSVAFGAAGLV